MAPHYFWFLGGIVLLILEMFIPGLVVIFFGFGALLTGVFTAIFNLPIGWEIVIFIISSLLMLFIFRKYLLKKFNKKIPAELENELIGNEAIVTQKIKPGLTGKVMLQDVPWKATSDVTIEEGINVKIIKTDNLTLFVQPIEDL